MKESTDQNNIDYISDCIVIRNVNKFFGKKQVLRNINLNIPYGRIYGLLDVKSQYTPRDLQTSANKNKESMKIKIKLTPDIPLKIGEIAQVIIPE